MERFLRLNTIFKICFISYLACMVGGWKAIPANQATYALRSGAGIKLKVDKIPDELLPRDSLNHIYKFGWCTTDAVSRQYFRKSINVTLPTWHSTQGTYLYLLTKKNSQNAALQCIIMKSYVPYKYLFLKSRLPLYYCQGVVLILMLTTINRIEIHEFFFYRKINMPINFNFEFYHPQIL